MNIKSISNQIFTAAYYSESAFNRLTAEQKTKLNDRYQRQDVYIDTFRKLNDKGYQYDIGIIITPLNTNAIPYTEEELHNRLGIPVNFVS